MHQPFAHTLPGEPPDRWEPLEAHLEQVSSLAGQNAASFGATEWARVAGLWHDLGKYSAGFQEYLRRSSQAKEDATDETVPGRVDHSTAGARHAVSRDAVTGRLLAYVIAGHHAGLADHGDLNTPGTLEARLNKRDPVIADALNCAPAPLLAANVPSGIPVRLSTDHSQAAFQLAFFTRMLFSALVDADYLATERFMSPERARQRSATPELAPLLDAVCAEIESRSDQARERRESDCGSAKRVADCRRTVAEDCKRSADRSPGFFTLTVPTGGGKTLASMRFALGHAVRHGLRRVIVAVPFTSIIDQNAGVYRDVFGASAVLEHHSNLDPDRESLWRRQTSENWDAPIVVTTTVQLFESLFAARPSACRKLHHIARSVIVLDEAQAVPVTLLRPILAALRELVDHYGCSVVLCTATQPALAHRAEFPIGLPLTPDREIIRDVPGLFAGLSRTRVEQVGKASDAEIVDRLLGSDSALVIVNTRRHASGLFALLRAGDDSALHLSASMCPAHRAVVLAEVRRRLVCGEPCRLVSTQVIEAGVDVDFPLVLRAMAGLDSIAQSAGRCNREGTLAAGRVIVFQPDPTTEGRLPESIRLARDAAGRVMPEHSDDPLSPEAMLSFFRMHYWNQKGHGFDSPKVMQCFALGATRDPSVPRIALDFRAASERFRMVDDHQRPVVVPYGTHGPCTVERLLRGEPPTPELWRGLQALSVNVPLWWLDSPNSEHVITRTEHGLHVLIEPRAYDEGVGLVMQECGEGRVWVC